MDCFRDWFNVNSDGRLVLELEANSCRSRRPHSLADGSTTVFSSACFCIVHYSFITRTDDMRPTISHTTTITLCTAHSLTRREHYHAINHDTNTNQRQYSRPTYFPDRDFPRFPSPCAPSAPVPAAAVFSCSRPSLAAAATPAMSSALRAPCCCRR
jgi:hypothetical protein